MRLCNTYVTLDHMFSIINTITFLPNLNDTMLPNLNDIYVLYLLKTSETWFWSLESVTFF